MFERSFDLTAVVDDHYGDVYRFALSLVHNESEASDLTQETFWRLADKGRQLRDPRKVKSWLFTTLHREFTGQRRHASRFPHADLEACDGDLPVVSPDVVEKLDGRAVLDALAQVDEVFRAPLALFYLEDYSYAEIAEVLGVPVGTIMSRLSRGKNRLKQLLADRVAEPEGAPILRFPRRAA
jgi:RNA polymerase sigma-70 factor (ECF subfamily)